MRRVVILAAVLTLMAVPVLLAAMPPGSGATPTPRTTFAAALVYEGGELFVGQPAEVGFFPMPASHAGAVFVYAPEGGRWSERAKLTSSSVQLGDRFGQALAVRGNIMAVGAPAQGEGRGAVYVFERAGAGAPWREVAHLRLDGATNADQLGSALGISGDVILAGAPGRANGRGEVVVFNRSASGWTRGLTLQADGTTEGDRFGSAISTDAARALIGAPGPQVWFALFGGQQPRPGMAFTFTRNGAESWRQEARLTTGATEPAAFGSAVLLSNDNAFVTAPLGAQATGTITRFARAENGWTEAERLTPAQAQPGSLLGISLARAGQDLLVGAPLLGNGSVLVFRSSGSRWEQTQRIQGQQAFGFFGGALAGGDNMMVIGAPGADFFEGTGFAYQKDASGQWQPSTTLMTEETTLDAITGGQRDCTQGRIEPFTCSGVDLVAFLPVKDLGGERGVHVNDIWGWTDALTNREYAIVGRNNGTSFVDVTDASNPRYLGDLPLHAGANPNVWRDMKVYADHAFIVSDGAGAHGMQVFDLRQLRNLQGPPRTFTETAHYDRIHSAHNIVINEQTGFAYVVGSSQGGETCGGGLHMVDIREPQNPKFAGCFADTRTGNARTGYSHDAQCIRYNGPDQQYVGKEICFGANETALSIADVSDKTKPVPIATAAYPNVAYLHQGWVSEDHRYLFMNDEGDELAGTVPRTRTLVWDIQDLDDPVLVKEYLGETPATDHNLYVKGNFIYESNYVSGLRIIDITDPKNPVETGFFDTVPWGKDAPGFAGSWSNYPFFRSGNIIVSSMREGLFILKQRPVRPVS